MLSLECAAVNAMEITYQPILNLQTGRIEKCEALCNPPEAGADIAAFFMSAEMNGSLRGFTDRVFDSVFSDWQKHGSPTTDVSVNLTVGDLAEPDLAKRVEKACKKHRLDPARLWFEVDDRAQSLVDPVGLQSMSQIVSLGVRFSIDGFGDELSQTTHYEVGGLPVAEIKINARYVRDADENMRHRDVVIASVTLARDLNIGVAAKSIERENIALLMRRLGCTHGQGFYFARPTAANVVAALVAKMAQAGPLESGR
jgi:EAL domain-containing protein (putative c-di-GMP-specific phosphodiesterase class I)